MKRWYVLYLKSRAEKKVLEKLTGKGIETFLPMQKKLRQWSDRKKLVEMPLMPGYIFVHVGRKEYDLALQTEHVACYVTFDGKAAPVKEDDITALKHILEQQEHFKVELTREDLEPGMQVEILAGPLVGIRGELIRLKGKHKVGIRIRQVHYTVMVEVPMNDLAVLT